MAVTNNKKSDAEDELLAAFASRTIASAPSQQCVSHDTLEQFAAGRVVDQEAQRLILGHIGQCSRCARIVVDIKRKREVGVTTRFRILAEKHAAFLRRAAVTAAAFLLIIAVALMWYAKHSVPTSPVVVVDLRVVAPTRSNDNAVPIRVTSGTSQLVIILPESRRSGQYEIEVRPRGTESAVLHFTASTRIGSHPLELIAAIDFSKVARGYYELAIRHASSDWEYVPIWRE